MLQSSEFQPFGQTSVRSKVGAPPRPAFSRSSCFLEARQTFAKFLFSPSPTFHSDLLLVEHQRTAAAAAIIAADDELLPTYFRQKRLKL